MQYIIIFTQYLLSIQNTKIQNLTISIMTISLLLLLLIIIIIIIIINSNIIYYYF